MCMQKFSSMLANRTRYAAWDFMAKCKMTTSVNLAPPSTDTFSFHCQDQMVKVDSKIYHLDRFRSSIKSNYFEKLFTAENFDNKLNEVLEIQPKNSEVFSNVVDLIHGKKLSEVMNKNNYIPLLEAMDHLDMEIDLKTVSEFIDDGLKSYSSENAKIFHLYKFVRKNPKFEYLMEGVFQHLSNNLTELQNHEILASFPLNHLIQLVKSVPAPDDKKRYEIVQLCSKWLCHDLENRLPHILTLVNSIKPEFHAGKYSNNMNNGVSRRLPKISVDEQAKMQIIQSCFFALLAHGGKRNPPILFVEDSFDQSYDGYDTDREFELQNYTDEYQPSVRQSSCYINRNREFNKLKEFMENGKLYDITVRVGEKTYKLHRAVLEANIGYFGDIFRTEYAEAMEQCHEIPKCLSKDKEYLLNDLVDSSTFSQVVKYIYLGKCNPSYNLSWSHDIQRVFKIAVILKIEGLPEHCISRLKDFRPKVNLQEVEEIVNHTYGKIKYESIYSTYYAMYVREKWPEIDMSQFHSTSWSIFENILKSPDFYFKDSRKVVDICSKWICHDVENRIHLLPKIARTLNPHCIIDVNEFQNEAVTDLHKYSSKFVGEKLWEILSSLSYTVAAGDEPKKSPTKFEEIPVFLAPSRNNIAIEIFNANLDNIETLTFLKHNIPSEPIAGSKRCHCPVSAAMIQDNLFIICNTSKPNFFEVYNLTSKKRTSLPFNDRLSSSKHVSSSDVRMNSPKSENILALLNCNNEIYCCTERSLIMKYSTQMNRWMMISPQDDTLRKHLRFTSDGEMLYRMYEVSDEKHFVFEAYDFEKNLWEPVPHLASVKHDGIDPQMQLTIINDRDLAVSFSSSVRIFDRDSRSWTVIDIPQMTSDKNISIFTQCEDRMLRLVRNELYHYSFWTQSLMKCEFKKKLPLRNECFGALYENLRYQTVAVIHRPRLCIN